MSEGGAGGARTPQELASVARGVMLVRLTSIALSVPVIVVDGRDEVPFTLGALAVILTLSLAPLLAWRRVEPVLLGHPLFLGIDIGVTVVFLAVAGSGAPYVVATLATAFLAGLLYGRWGATVGAVLLVVAYGAVATSASGSGNGWVLVIALYPLLAVAGVGLAALLDRLQAARQAETDAVRLTAAAEERGRLARELHDSLGKTLHGIALSAAALRRTGNGPVVTEAETIERAAKVAADEARQLMAELRAPLVVGSLRSRLEQVVTRWSADRATRVGLDVDLSGSVPVGVADELVRIVEEALENVARHARAERVHIRVLGDERGLVLSVADDGAGMREQRADEALLEGRFGLVGMRERAAAVGGELHLDTSGRGTRVEVRVPRTAAPSSTGLGTVRP